jgi:pimeloyl-ACP methyl ester carboxylesterase
MRAARARLAAVETAIAHTPYGSVVYVDEGVGVPLLVSHGVLGGHDNVRDLVNLWIGPGYRTIGPSRFGYLGSTIEPHATPARQADAYRVLLDHLGIERAVAVGVSAGAPSAIQLALRHAERLYGLVLLSAYLPGMGARPLPTAVHPVLRAIAGWDWGWWQLKTRCPRLLARIMGVPKGWDPSHDTDFVAIRDALFPTRDKKHGIVFDAVVSEPASNGFPLEDIAVPTLLVHSADDPLAPYEHVPVAAARVPEGRLLTVEAGGHLFLGHSQTVRTATSAFIEAVVH